MGNIEDGIIKQAKRAGNPIPDRILNKPVLRIGLSIFLEAFFDLDSERTHSFGLTAIPWTSIKKYAESYEFDQEMTEDLLYLVREMDDENLRLLKKRQGWLKR